MQASSRAEETDKAAWVRAMFARIVPAYDAVNSVMTLGRDRYWRRAAVELVKPKGKSVLDVATGTGELALELCRQGSAKVVALDFCPEMLSDAARKVSHVSAPAGVSFVAGDALALPFADNSFDAVVNGFLLRNLARLDLAFAEFRRVLKPGGRLACLDVTHPRPPFKPLFMLYFNSLVPLIGGLMSGDREAYRYLPNSLKSHPDARKLARVIAEAGLAEVNFRLFNFGTIAVHTAVKPRARPRSR
jgi:demethylmenaquinone methyltransferase / 2-methoxy-6-polyprenyl-1,4-benzoquinol methylase